MMIRLFTTFYPEKNIYRLQELLTSLKINLESPFINKVYILSENSNFRYFSNTKMELIHVKKRPTYTNFFQIINNICENDDIEIIANTDIYFDYNIGVLNYIDLNNKCFVLSRWNIQPDNSAKLFNRHDSQDVWIFKGKIKEEVFGNFPLGIPFCDNRILYELQKAGYKILNPAYSIKAFHLHAGIREEYSKEKLSLYVDPPYMYLFPHNLYSLPITIWFNWTQRYKLGQYKYDQKKVNNWFIIKVVRKIWKVTTRRKFPLIGYGTELKV